jgi:hypothetical protein
MVKTQSQLMEWLADKANRVARQAQVCSVDYDKDEKNLLEIEIASFINVLDQSKMLDLDHIFSVAATLRGVMSENMAPITPKKESGIHSDKCDYWDGFRCNCGVMSENMAPITAKKRHPRKPLKSK